MCLGIMKTVRHIWVFFCVLTIVNAYKLQIGAPQWNMLSTSLLVLLLPSVMTAKPPNYTHRNLNLLPPVGKCGYQIAQDRIFGGDITGIDELPWMALLEYKKNGKSVGHWCGGMIINEIYVLTAAHCIVGKITRDIGILFRVRLGEYNRNTTIDCIILPNGSQDCAESHQDIKVKNKFVHAKYVKASGDRHNDIGILRLTKKIKYNDFVKPICLPINVPRTQPGQRLIVAGWGLTESNTYSQFKRQVSLPVVDDQKCRQIFRRFGETILDTQLCAGGEKGRDSCFGDSGGPLIQNFPNSNIFFVEGIVSYGTRCGTIGIPSVNTRVSEYLDWILEHMTPF